MTYLERTTLLWLSVLRKKYPDKNVPRWNEADIGKELSKLVRIDKLNEREVFNLCVYATNDRFWQNNLKSPFQLRAKSKSDGDFKKWEIIRDQMLARGLWHIEKPKQKVEADAGFRDVLGNLYE